MVWRLTVDIYEAEAYPIVRHQFFGRTAKEAWHYYESHLEADDFLNDCIEKGEYGGRVRCRAVVLGPHQVDLHGAYG